MLILFIIDYLIYFNFFFLFCNIFVGLFFSRKGERKVRKKFPFNENKIEELQKIVEISFYETMNELQSDLVKYAEENNENIEEIVFVGRFASAIAFHSSSLKSILSNSVISSKKNDHNLSETTRKLLSKVTRLFS